MKKWTFDRYRGQMLMASGALVTANTETGALLKCFREYAEPSNSHRDTEKFKLRLSGRNLE